MKRPRTLAATAATIGTLAIAGCSQPAAETPAPTATSAPSTTTPAPGKPEVTNPKDLAALADKPCQLLTSTQLNKLGAANTPKSSQSAWGEASCDWGGSTNVMIGVAPATKQDVGLANVLDDAGINKPQKQVNGYPMVVAQELSFSCGVYVSVTSTDIFFVSAAPLGSDVQDKDPCAVAKRAAGMVLSNLPPLKK